MHNAFEVNKVYHVYTHANGNDNLFREDENYNYFLRKYAEVLWPVVETFAYCLMPNHLHLMVRVREEERILSYLQIKRPTLRGFETLGGLSSIISRQFSHLLNGYAQAFNRKYARKGSLFHPKIKRKLIDQESYFTALVAYIHNNPVHHGFVIEPGDWKHSSWNSILSKSPTKLKKEAVLDWFGGKEEFIRLHSLLKKKGDLLNEFE